MDRATLDLLSLAEDPDLDRVLQRVLRTARAAAHARYGALGVPDGRVAPARGWTRLAIGPQRPPRVVGALLTGLHEPQASHFDLLRAFVPEPLLRRAYVEAIERGYLWHEFGDSALVL